MIKKIKIMICICVLIFPQTRPITSVSFSWPHHLKLLSKSHHLLSQLSEKNYCYQPCNCAQQEQCIQLDSTSFFHPRIKACISTIQCTKSLKPIMQLYNPLMYMHAHDVQFMHEFYMLLFIIHKQIIVRTCAENPQAHKNINLEKILEISEKINQLPIAELLNAIDMLVTELPPLLEKYEFNSKITWKEWFIKYWWVPPIFGGWFALKILLSLQRPHYYFAPYLSSKPTIPLPPIITNDPVLNEIIIQK